MKPIVSHFKISTTMQNIKPFWFLLFIFLNHCKNENKQFDPIFIVLETGFDQRFIRSLEKSKEKDALYTHFESFLHGYKNLSEKDKEISLFLQEHGLKEDAEQAYVLLLLWYRKLSNKKLDFPELIKMAGNERTGVNSCAGIRRVNAVNNFRKLSINDKVGLQFTNSHGAGKNIKSASYFDCPIVYWNFDTLKDIFIEGDVVNKYGEGNPEEYFIQVKITYMNDKNSLFLYRPIQVGDTIEVNLVSYGMKI
jgi:hypothetical protein